MIDKGTSVSLKISPFRRSRCILTAENLGDAIRGCDTFAKAKVVFGPMALGCVNYCGILCLYTHILSASYDRHVGGSNLLRNNRTTSWQSGGANINSTKTTRVL